MREIKFRAWNRLSKEMFYMSYKNHFQFDSSGWCINNYAENEPKTKVNFDNGEVMQYIGLKDCKDKEIYEGDIVRVGGLTVVIDYYKGSYYYSEKGQMWGTPISKCSGVCDASNILIVGNIYENPELLS